MAKKVIMPKFGMDQEEGTVVAWLKAEGDAVEKGEAILEVETDKVNMEVEANATGILAGIQIGPGITVPIGETIAFILAPDEPLPEAARRQESADIPSDVSKTAALPIVINTTKATPVATRMAETHGINVERVQPIGRQKRVTKADVAHHLNQQAASPNTDKILAVPAARRLARELAVDLQTIQGTGPMGRIQSRDVNQFVASQERQIAADVQTTPAPFQPAIRRTIPHTGMRRTIAQRLTASVREVPQFTVGVDVNMAQMQSVLNDLREFSDGPRITMTALLIKACASTLARHPNVNASFREDDIVEWAEVNVGVAVAVDAGLVVPVVHHAEQLGVQGIATTLSALGERAHVGKLKAEHLQGGTFSISNLGMYGVDQFSAIINPPQAAILAVGRTAKRPIVVEDDRLIVQPMCTLTLTADHRVVDGAAAAQFLTDLQKVVERPMLLLA